MSVKVKERLDEYISKVTARSEHFIGYPIATDFDYSDLYQLLRYPLNNQLTGRTCLVH